MTTKNLKLDTTKLKRSDFSFTYDHYSYMLTYKGKMIGGAGSDRSKRKNHSNLAFYRGQAEIAIRDIMDNGRCAPYMKKNIIDIDDGSLDWLGDNE
jgi:hypothetical protein